MSSSTPDRRLRYLDAPWSVPVPVAPLSGCASLRPEHAECAVITDLGSIGAFAVAQRPGEDLLHADLQSPVWAADYLRLGSGRSGCYRGYYLKGVGRTLVAGHWNTDDWYHLSGHLCPSSAVREYLASVYADARGLSRQIVACEGVLLRRLDPAFREQLARLRAFGALFPIDQELQAISVKRAGFARLTNFLWLATRLCGGEALIDLARLLLDYCLNETDPALDPQAATTGTVVAALRRAVKRTLTAFELYAAAGIEWGSLFDNMTLDGRFLDLETALITARPFFGGKNNDFPGDDRERPPTRPFGTEGISYGLYLRHGLTRLARGLRSLESPSIAPRMLQLVDEIATGLESIADGDLLGEDALVKRALAGFSEVDLSPSGRDRLEPLLREFHRSALTFTRFDLASFGVTLERTEVSFEALEPASIATLWLPSGSYRASDWEDALFIEQRIRPILRCTDVDTALSLIDQAGADIRQRFSAERFQA